MKTTRASVSGLSKFLINNLVRDGVIEINLEKRQQFMEDMENLFFQYVKSQEDLDKGIDHMILPPSATMSEGEVERLATKIQNDSLKENAHRGLYYLISIRQLATEIKSYLWTSKLIEEIYMDDNQLIQKIVETTRQFDPNNQQV